MFSADPANHVAFRCTFWGAWCNEDKERLVQAIFYEDVGHVKLGDYFTLDAAEQRAVVESVAWRTQRAEESCPHGPARAVTVWLKPPPFTGPARRMLASSQA